MFSFKAYGPIGFVLIAGTLFLASGGGALAQLNEADDREPLHGGKRLDCKLWDGKKGCVDKYLRRGGQPTRDQKARPRHTPPKQLHHRQDRPIPVHRAAPPKRQHYRDPGHRPRQADQRHLRRYEAVQQRHAAPVPRDQGQRHYQPWQPDTGHAVIQKRQRVKKFRQVKTHARRLANCENIHGGRLELRPGDSLRKARCVLGKKAVKKIISKRQRHGGGHYTLRYEFRQPWIQGRTHDASPWNISVIWIVFNANHQIVSFLTSPYEEWYGTHHHHHGPHYHTHGQTHYHQDVYYQGYQRQPNWIFISW